MRILCLLLLAFAAVSASAAYKMRETTYSARWCAAHGGETEVRLAGGTRADCVTADHAIEVERAPKWYQAIGQSLWYAFQTNKRAGIVMIIGDGDLTYWHRMNSVIEHNHLPIDVWRIPE